MESFEQQLFEWYCQHYKIVLLVDGFDEVTPDYTSIVLQLLQLYKKHFCEKLWVTTQSGNVLNELENKLEVCSYSLLPFTVEDTKQFFRMFWGPQLEKLSKNLEVYIVQSMKYLSESIDQGEQQLTSVPLQAQMFATVFLEHFEEVISTEDLFKQLDLITLYEKFIDIKFNVILMEHKNKIDSSIPNNMHRLENDFKQFQNKHKPVAMYALFNQEDAEKLLDKKEIEMVLDFVQEVQSSIEKTGIVTRVVENKPVFIHKTYAEFFAASFMWEKYTKLMNREFDVFVKNLIEIIFKYNTTQIAKFVFGIAKKRMQDCSNVAGKAFILFTNLWHSPEYCQINNKEIFSYLLAVVECSLVRNSYEQLEQFHNYMTENKLETSKLLINFGANIKLKNKEGWTALHLAARNNYVKIVHMLIYGGADIDSFAIDNGETPLSLAVEMGHLEMVELLISLKANINLKNKEGWTALHLAARNDFAEIARILINRGADIDSFAIDNGETPLSLAVEIGHLEMVELLISLKANINLKNKEGWTALHLAARNDFAEIAQILINRGAELSSANDNGETPMHLAIKMRHVEMVELLISLGANTKLKNKVG